ncbi:hypothetical protein Tco_1120936 [Tanacetum coccineum]|uniref:Uncharacterized protein n=1 Tax=Tanacetum coccineum TaxID=301880 RepID=A0ABQ5IXB6_9ASTR
MGCSLLLQLHMRPEDLLGGGDFGGTIVRNFAAMTDLSLRLSVSWRGRKAYASSMPHILSLPLSMACDNGDGHGSQTLIPNVSRASSFVIMLVGAAVAGQGNGEFIDREEHRGGGMHLGVMRSCCVDDGLFAEVIFFAGEGVSQFRLAEKLMLALLFLGLNSWGGCVIDVYILNVNQRFIVSQGNTIQATINVDGNEDMVDNRYLKANYPLLIIEEKDKDLKISDEKTKSKDNDKGSRSKIAKHEGTSLQRRQRQRSQELNDKKQSH